MGLSPRVRGNPSGGRSEVCHRRSIPARAGEPSWGSERFSPGAVYPRACGGTPAKRPWLTSSLGLSPRVRGNLPRNVRIL